MNQQRLTIDTTKTSNNHHQLYQHIHIMALTIKPSFSRSKCIQLPQTLKSSPYPGTFSSSCLLRQMKTYGSDIRMNVRVALGVFAVSCCWYLLSTHRVSQPKQHRPTLATSESSKDQACRSRINSNNKTVVSDAIFFTKTEGSCTGVGGEKQDNNSDSRDGSGSGRDNVPLKHITDNLKRLGIKVLAIDFDQTLINIHTEGMWWRDNESIVPYIRPQFRALIVEVLKNHNDSSDRSNLTIAIVSFSSQVNVIRAVLQDILDQAAKDLEDCGGGLPTSADQIQVQAFMPRFFMVKGKQEHLENLKCSLHEVLLIDDSQLNILIALHHGVRAIWFNPDHPNELWDDLATLE